MQKKILVVALGALGSILSGQTIAQNAIQNNSGNPVNNQAIQPQGLVDVSEKVVIQGVEGQLNAPQQTPVQLANPYGSVPPAQGQEINYGGVNTIDGNRMIVPPNQAAGYPQQVAPATPPTGMPNQMDQLDSVQATINILNTPDGRIREINRDIYKKGQIINESPVIPPKAVNGLLTASISPGSVPPVVRLAKNRTTAIIITDINGQPWPIINYDGLSSEDFVVKRLDNPAPDGYVLSVTPKGAFVNGNLALILKGLPSPLSIEFISGQKEVDAKTEIRVQAVGPNTQYTSLSMPQGIDTDLLSLLQGVAPSGAKQLKVNSNAAQAWVGRDGKMYLRTRHKIMSPAFENVSSSPDGTYAYKMMPVPVVLYKATEGRYGEFGISGF